MPLLDDLTGTLKNLYGNGGAGDPLISIGMGLLSQRGVGRGLAAGFQNAAQMSDLANQRARQAMLDKLAQERETRAASNEAFRQQYMIDEAKRQQANSDRTFTQGQQQLNQPHLIDVPQADGTTVKQWITPGGIPGATVGAPVKQRTPYDDALDRERAQKVMRDQQANELGLTGEDAVRFRATGQIAAPNEKVTNDQANAALFTRRMAASNDILSKPEIWKSGTGWAGAEDNLLSKVPVVGNFLVGKEFQQNRQAQEDFINSVLRRESGAAISPSEFDHANRQYFPQPGDSEEVIVQKAANRENAMKGILGATAPSFQKSFAAERMANPASGSVGSAPAAGNDDLAKAREILKLRPDMKQQVVNELLKKGVNPSGL